jgi:hypothetical protein
MQNLASCTANSVRQCRSNPVSGRRCCSFTDGFAVSDVDWESKDGHYRVRLENNWIDVPDDALITEPNRAGRTMVWPLRFDGQIFIRCFMPGSMG